jgi:hypothetical protein
LRKSTSVFVESNGIAQSLSLVQYISSREPKLRGASKHPHEEVLHFGSRETTMSARCDGTILDHLAEHMLYLNGHNSINNNDIF